MNSTSRYTAFSIALFACLAPLAACSASPSPGPGAVAGKDGGPEPGNSDASPEDAAPAPTPDGAPAPTPDAGPTPSIDPALLGTWRTNDTLDNFKSRYTSFSLTASLQADGVLAITTDGAYDATSFGRPGCTEKYSASGSYSTKAGTLVVSGAGTQGDTFGKINRTGCKDPADNVADGTMTDSIRGSLFNSLAGPYTISGGSFTVTTSSGAVLTFTKP